MKRRVSVLLSAAAAAVVLENVLYFRTSSPPAAAPDEVQAEPAAETEGEPGAVARVCEEALRAYLAALPGPELRSAFLTRAEAAALAASGLPSEPQPHGRPTLAGTLLGAGRRVAWVDGIAASEGDAVAGFELERIEPRAVVLRSGAERLRLELAAPEEPQP
jgi:hypothetical protein